MLGILLFCAGGCVEIRLRVRHAGCDSARAVRFDEIVVFLSEIKPRDLYVTSTVHYDHIKYL